MDFAFTLRKGVCLVHSWISTSNTIHVPSYKKYSLNRHKIKLVSE